MSINPYQIIKKLYQGSNDQAIQDILNFYNQNDSAIINLVYGYMLVNRSLLENEAQKIQLTSGELDFRKVLLDADFILPDGAALRTLRLVGHLLGRWKGPRMLHNLNGTDFLPYFLDYLHASDYHINIITFTVYDPRLDNKKGALKKGALDYISQHRPKFSVHGEEILYGDTNYDQFDWTAVEGFLSKQQETRNKKQETVINLFLNFRGGSYGWPHQELFAYINKNKLKELKLLCMNLGATVDFRTGKETRAPKRIRALRLESAYRLFSHPQLNWKKFLMSFKVIGLIIRKVIFTPTK